MPTTGLWAARRSGLLFGRQSGPGRGARPHPLRRGSGHLRCRLVLRKLASMQGVGRGTTDQPPALNTNLLLSGAQQQQSSATIVPFYTQPRPRSVRVRTRPESAPKPSGRERSALWRRCDKLPNSESLGAAWNARAAGRRCRRASASAWNAERQCRLSARPAAISIPRVRSSAAIAARSLAQAPRWLSHPSHHETPNRSIPPHPPSGGSLQ